MNKVDLKQVGDLSQYSVPELDFVITEAQKLRSEKLEGAKEALLSDFKDKAAALGLSLNALMGSSKPTPERKQRRSKGEKVAAKYRNPETGDTWTGRGREPSWIKGKNRDEFALSS